MLALKHQQMSDQIGEMQEVVEKFNQGLNERKCTVIWVWIENVLCTEVFTPRKLERLQEKHMSKLAIQLG